jgi:signal transduction histidine kinase
MVDEHFRPVDYEGAWYNDLEVALAQWASQHPQTDVVSRIVVNDTPCYVELGTDDDSGYMDEILWIAYVDVSPEQSLVRTVSLVFVIIALVGGIAVGFAGWMVGKRLETAEEAQKRFYENMSHELKTPLAAIRGYAEGMQSGVVEPNRASRAIVRESERMSHLVEQILSLSRLEAGAVPIHRERVEVEDLVQDCLMPFEGIVRTRRLDVELDLSPGNVNADLELMEHALENIFSNAMRHAEHVVRVLFDGRTLMVENDGDMPRPEDMAHLFDRFHVSEGGSTGIGLALAHEIVTQHGWKLTAQLRDGLMCLTIDFSG